MSKIPTIEKKNKITFIESFATKTRLMGVIALKVVWNKNSNRLIQWFNLNSEEWGIYDYEEMLSKNFLEEEKVTARFMKHLGGAMVPLTEKEAFFLIQYYAKESLIYKKEIPQKPLLKFILDKRVMLSNNELAQLNNKIFEDIEKKEELVHYFIMRAVGRDFDGLRYLLTEDAKLYDIQFAPVEKASVLLKNEIIKTKYNTADNTYITKSLVDNDGKYTTVVSLIKLNDKFLKVCEVELKDVRETSPDEAAYEINLPEFINVYKVLDEDQFKTFINSYLPHPLAYQFPQGKMLVEFRKNNNHVKKEIFYISGDIQFIFFINHYKQFITCSYDLEDFKEIELSLLENSFISKIKSFQLNASIIYKYAEMQKIDFIEYINNSVLME